MTYHENSTLHRARALARLRAQALTAERYEDPWLANLCWRKHAQLACILTQPTLRKNTRERLW